MAVTSKGDGERQAEGKIGEWEKVSDTQYRKEARLRLPHSKRLVRAKIPAHRVSARSARDEPQLGILSP